MNNEPLFPNDKDREQSAEMPREIETKIINLGDPEKFIERLQGIGAVLIIERRLLQDRSFRKQDKSPVSATDGNLNVGGIKDPTDLSNVLELLGVDIVSEPDENGIILIRTREGAPVRSIRLRKENNQTFFTVKEKRKKKQTVDNRFEAEMEVMDEASLLQLLESMGYSKILVKEKYRTTYGLEGCKIELNEGPIAPPWVEIEAGSEEQVLAIVEKLGYKPEDLGGMSDADFYKMQVPQLTEEELNDFTFERLKNRATKDQPE